MIIYKMLIWATGFALRAMRRIMGAGKIILRSVQDEVHGHSNRQEDCRKGSVGSFYSMHADNVCNGIFQQLGGLGSDNAHRARCRADRAYVSPQNRLPRSAAFPYAVFFFKHIYPIFLISEISFSANLSPLFAAFVKYSFAFSKYFIFKLFRFFLW